MSAPPLDIHAIDHHIVRSAIEALNGRNKKQWYELFSDNPAFTEMEILSIYQMMREIFGPSLAYLAWIDIVEDGADGIWGVSRGLIGRFQDLSDSMRENEKISKIAVSQPNYWKAVEICIHPW